MPKYNMDEGTATLTLLEYTSLLMCKTDLVNLRAKLLIAEFRGIITAAQRDAIYAICNDKDEEELDI